VEFRVVLYQSTVVCALAAPVI